ncbi:hypothetical protein C2845_PM03G01540 [Panicum miliaceum]|uniref:Uncharacterized protein n=1 Tax=Panicum miliaceum TaxID=4540 RepID=A0A3L6T6J3_PANMI|nr:hypothetical protein C2845_PM03G01540 [Panicum miliaceum]
MAGLEHLERSEIQNSERLDQKKSPLRAEYRAVKRDVRKQVDPKMQGKTRAAEPFHLQ